MLEGPSGLRSSAKRAGFSVSSAAHRLHRVISQRLTVTRHCYATCSHFNLPEIKRKIQIAANWSGVHTEVLAMKTCIEVLAILLYSAIAASPQGDAARAADMWNDMARTHQMQGRYQEAEALYKRALAAREKLFGPDDPRVATI